MIQDYCLSRSALEAVPLERACALLGLDRSGFYRNTVPQTPLENETALREAIETIVVEFSLSFQAMAIGV